MAKTATLQDTFPGSTFNATTWAAFNNMTCSNKALATVNASTTVYCVLQTQVTMDATNSTAVSWLTSAGNQALVSLEVYALQFFLGGGTNGNSNVAFYINQNSLSASYDTGAGIVKGATATYDATKHKYFQIAESGGTVTWSTSADGQHFTTMYTHADPITLTAITVQLVAGTYQNEASGTTVTWAEVGSYGPVGPAVKKVQSLTRAAVY